MRKLTGFVITILIFCCASAVISQVDFKQAKSTGGKWYIVNTTTADTAKTQSLTGAFDLLNIGLKIRSTIKIDSFTVIVDTLRIWVGAQQYNAFRPGAAPGGGATTFLGLTDTPVSYAGQGSNFVKVNAGATALEFVASSVSAHAILSASHSDAATSTVVRGDIITGQTATPQWDRLALGASGTILRSNGTDLAYTTATWPATTTINQLLFSSAANTVGGLATANNGILITSAGGIPSISSTIPNATQDNITRLGTITSPSNVVLNNQANVFGDFNQSFRNTRLRLANPANTFFYTITTSAIVANRAITLPLLTAADEFTLNTFAATLANKTLTTPTIADLSNMTHLHTSAAAGGFLDVAAINTGIFGVVRGGIGVGTITGIMQGNGTGAVTGIANSSTVGQVLRVTGPSTYLWGALDLADADAVTGELPDGNIPDHTGDATGGTALTIVNNAVTNAKAADMIVNAIKMRVTAGTGDPEDIINTGLTTVSGVSGDFLVLWDADDSFNLKKVNASDFLGGSVAWEGIADAGAAGEILFADFNQDMTWDTPATATATDAFRFRWTHDATTDGLTQRLLTLERSAAGAGTHPLENLLYIVNADDQIVDKAIEIISTSTGVITTALDASDAEIVTALDIGANTIVTAAGTITSVELDRLTGLAGIIVTDITAVTNIDGNSLTITAGTLDVDVASVTVVGAVELATAAETTTGTDPARAVTPDGFAGSDYGKRVVTIILLDDTQANVVADGQADITFTIPLEMNGWNLVLAHVSLEVVGTTGTQNNQVHNVTQAVNMLSTAITVDTAELTSYTAATQPVVDTLNDDVATGDKIRFDTDGIHSGTAAQGLQYILTFQLP